MSLLLFLNEGFTFQPYVWNKCHDLVMMSMNLSNITILNIKGGDYRFIGGIAKSELINFLTQSIDLTKKCRTV